MDGVSDFYRLHSRTNGERGGIALDEDGDPFCVHRKGCALRNLTTQELFFPLIVDELTPYKTAIDPHRDN